MLTFSTTQEEPPKKKAKSDIGENLNLAIVLFNWKKVQKV